MKVGLLGLSNPCSYDSIAQVKENLIQKGYEVAVSPILDQRSTPAQRADIWNQWMKQDFDVIYDVSGGDLANETILHLDLDAYQRSTTLYCGYSDLSCVLNVLASIRPCLLYQIRNNEKIETDFSYHFIQGDEINGTVVGGNIRCLLKLAGTGYFPECKDKVLFLEGLSGSEYRIRTFFAQLNMMGVFSQISGLILGQFTELDEKNIDVYFYRDYYSGPVIRTHEIGHSKGSKAIWIGKEIHLKGN